MIEETKEEVLYYYFDKVPCNEISKMPIINREYSILGDDESTKELKCLITKRRFFDNTDQDCETYISIYPSHDDPDLYYIDELNARAICSFDKEKLIKSHQETLKWYKDILNERLQETISILESYEVKE